jgi:hypothetical protein
MSRTLWPLAAIAMIAVIVAGCSNGSENGNTGTTSSSGTTRNSGTANSSGSGSSSGSAGTGSNNNATAREKAVKFAACMRENGYPDFPDPKASGEFPTFGISVSPEVWTEALGACKDLQPPGSFSGQRTPEQQSAALKFAQCIRENGVKDFPDPVNGDPIVDTTKIPSTDRPGGMTILNAAMQKCGDLVGEAMGGGAGGGG